MIGGIWTLIGAGIGLLTAVGLGWLLATGMLPWWLVLLVALILLVLGYVAAALAATSPYGEVLRGYLVGLNAGMNGLVGWALLQPVNTGLAVALGVILAGMPLVSVFARISRNPVYRRMLGWMNWILPMSWPVVGLGVLFTALSLLGHVFLFWPVRWQFSRVAGLRVYWRDGAFFLRGGWISNLNYLQTAFNMGNFNYVHNVSIQWHVAHEIGHALNLGAFGSVFHLAGAIDENLLRRGWNAYAERLAESNNPETVQHNVIYMWGRRFDPVGPHWTYTDFPCSAPTIR